MYNTLIGAQHIRIYLIYTHTTRRHRRPFLSIRDEKTRMKVTPPLAVAPITQDDDMRWNPNDDGIVSNPYKGAARPITTASMPPQHPARIK